MKDLTKPHVHIKDKDKTEEKLKRLIEGSDDKLQVGSAGVTPEVNLRNQLQADDEACK